MDIVCWKLVIEKVFFFHKILYVIQDSDFSFITGKFHSTYVKAVIFLKI